MRKVLEVNEDKSDFYPLLRKSCLCQLACLCQRQHHHQEERTLQRLDNLSRREEELGAGGGGVQLTGWDDQPERPINNIITDGGVAPQCTFARPT